ncbi:MAG: flagellar biosynthetic protein FliR [Thalassovita sp.]
MSEMALIFAWVQEALWEGFTVFLRIGAIVALLPGVGERSVPVRIKLALAVVFTAVTAPVLQIPPPEGPLRFAIYIATEPLIGVALGLTVRLFIMALQTAGSIAAQSTSLSQILGHSGAEPMPAIGHLLVVAGLCLAMISDLHIRVIQLMIASYDLWPVGQFPDPLGLSTWGIHNIAQSFALAFTVAAPFVVISLLYNIALGAINRAMPQLMVAFVGAPLITFGGLALLLLLAPMMLTVWNTQLSQFLANPLRAN